MRKPLSSLLSVMGAIAVVASSMVGIAPPASAEPASSEAQAAVVEHGREQINFNGDWRFVRQDPQGAEKTDFDDSAWTDVALPHNFDAPYDVGGSNGGQSFYVGTGWYRKSFNVPDTWQGKTLQLDFQGSFQVTDLWVNGQLVGTHRGGYTGFVFDITPYIREGANQVAVKVDSSWRHDLAPRTGDHQFSGGIYRDVTLDVTDPVHVAWYGTFVTTPALTNPDWATSDPSYYRNIDLGQYPSEDQLQANIDARQSNVRVQTEVQNDASAPVDVELRHIVKDPDGNEIGSFSSAVQTIPADSTATIDAVSGALNDPSSMLKNLRLWKITDPSLYTVETTVLQDSNVDGTVTDGTEVDTFQSTFGFRSAQWKVDGFYLNGEKTLLYGAGTHQDEAGWGNAVTDAGFFRDVQMVREAGMNFIRAVTYPHDPAYADATDQLGVMLWTENVFWGMGGQAGNDSGPAGRPSDWLKDAYPQNPADEAKFEQSVEDALVSMIRVNRNHPSIINWSMGNEVFFTSDRTQDKAKALVSRMRDLSHQLDPTRKAGMGGVQREGYDQLSVSDIAGYNGDGGVFENTWMPNMASEYASHSSDRAGSYDPHYDYVADPSDRESFKLQANSAGLAVWAGFDHGTIGGPFLARMGMVDYYRLPKDQWYWYRANKARWTGMTTVPDPVPVPREQSVTGTATSMSLEPSKYSSPMIQNDGRSDTDLVVTLRDANGAWVNQTRPVTLTVVDGPGIFAGGKTYTFTPGLSMFDGKAAMSFRSYFPGVTTIVASSPGLPDASLKVATEDVVGVGDAEEPADFGDASRWSSSGTPVTAPIAYGGTNKALSRPLTASSELSGSGRALAADGDISTAWQAASTGPDQSIASFLEFAQFVYKVKVVFPDGELPYTLELRGADGNWTTVASYTAGTVGGRPTEESIDGSFATGVRVAFPGLGQSQRAAVAELQVFGNDAAQSPQYAADSAYVSDIIDFEEDVATGWGQKVKDLSGVGLPISVAGVTYTKGLGLHADSSATVEVDSRYSRIAGVIGIDDESKGGDATFRIVGDGNLLYSKSLTSGESAAFDLSVSGVKNLQLFTDSNGDNTNDLTDWADLRLLGAPRDLSRPDSATQVQSTGMTASLRAGEAFRDLVVVKNAGVTTRNYTVSVGLYDASNRLTDVAMKDLTLLAGKEQGADLTVDLPSDITGYHAVVDVWDRSTLERVTVPVEIGTDPARLTGSAPIIWQTKVDGQSDAIERIGTWGEWPTSDAYNGSETFTEESGARMKTTFIGEQVRISAKFDGGKDGFSVLLDGRPVGSVSTRATDGSNTYKIAWISPDLDNGSHTLEIVSEGKIGINYIEIGSTAGSPQPERASLVQVIGLVLDAIRADRGMAADADVRGTLTLSLAKAYGTFMDSGASGNSLTQAGQELQSALDALLADGGSVRVTPSATSDSTPNAAGWYRSPVSLSFSTQPGGLVVEHRVNSVGEWINDPVTVLVDAQGQTIVEYRAVRDGSSVSGSESSTTVKLDSVAPTSSAKTDPQSGSADAGQSVMVTFSAVDETSGVDHIEYSIDGGTKWSMFDGSGLTISDAGRHEVRYRAFDLAGNVEEVKSVSVTVAATVATPTSTAEPTSGITTNPTAPAGNLALTGVPDAAVWITFAGAVLVLIGALLLVRRRRQWEMKDTDGH